MFEISIEFEVYDTESSPLLCILLILVFVKNSTENVTFV